MRCRGLRDDRGVLDGLEVWSLDLDDLALVGNKTGATRLGFAVLLKFFESRARFPLDRAEVPVEAVAFLAEQVGVEFGSLAGYDWSGRSWKRHRAQIRRRFGFRSWSQLEDAEPLVDWLVAGPLAAGLRGWPLEASAGQWCRERRVEPPAASTLSRLIGKAQHQFDERFCVLVVGRLGPAAVRLDMLVHADERDVFTLVLLRSGTFAGVSDKAVALWRARAEVETPSLLLAHPSAVRATMLAAWCWSRETEITDALIDVLLATVHRIFANATQRVQTAVTVEARRVDAKSEKLYLVAKASLACPQGTVADVVFPVVGEDVLQAVVDEHEQSGGSFREGTARRHHRGGRDLRARSRRDGVRRHASGRSGGGARRSARRGGARRGGRRPPR